MDSLYVLLPIALIFFGLAVWLFIWAVGDKQFDDLEKEGQRILFDQERSTTHQSNPTRPPRQRTPLSK